jgi:hypothetical protein
LPNPLAAAFPPRARRQVPWPSTPSWPPPPRQASHAGRAFSRVARACAAAPRFSSTASRVFASRSTPTRDASSSICPCRRTRDRRADSRFDASRLAFRSSRTRRRPVAPRRRRRGSRRRSRATDCRRRPCSARGRAGRVAARSSWQSLPRRASGTPRLPCLAAWSIGSRCAAKLRKA